MGHFRDWANLMPGAVVGLLQSIRRPFATVSLISASIAPGHYDASGAWSLTNGNLTASVTPSSPATATGNGSMGAGSKSYFEIAVVTNAGNVVLGITQDGNAINSAAYGPATAYCYLSVNGNKYSNGTSVSAYGSTYGAGDTIGVALDNVNGLLWFSKNGTWQNSATITEVQNGVSTHAAFTGLAGNYFPVFGNVTGSAAISVTLNFGASAFSQTVPTGFTGLYF